MREANFDGLKFAKWQKNRNERNTKLGEKFPSIEPAYQKGGFRIGATDLNFTTKIEQTIKKKKTFAIRFLSVV